MPRRTLLLPLLLSLAGCSHGGELPPPDFDADIEAARQAKGYRRPPTPRGFSICRAYGCNQVEHLSFTNQEWRTILALFDPPPADADAERQRVARAIARLEQLVGERTGTHRDLGGTFPGAFQEGQMDCVDEASNTTAYLTMFHAAGVLRFHQVEIPAWRGFVLVGGWPHTAAVIRESASGELFVVDSWFHNNGLPPEIVPLQAWQEGWNPS